VQAAAFFDLDRTLIRRSSALALAGPFQERGLIGRKQLAKAAAWQIVFAARGAGAETVRKAAEDGLMVLKGLEVEAMRALVAEAVRELAAAEDIDLTRSTAYSDSHTDLPFLEAVGRSVVVNPDRELRRIARERGWPILAFSDPLYPAARRRMRPALVGVPLVLGAAVWAARRRAA
jgi:phosphoserine phosphatase